MILNAFWCDAVQFIQFECRLGACEIMRCMYIRMHLRIPYSKARHAPHGVVSRSSLVQ
jgi:hypothetical protein